MIDHLSICSTKHNSKHSLKNLSSLQLAEIAAILLSVCTEMRSSKSYLRETVGIKVVLDFALHQFNDQGYNSICL